MVHGRQVGRWVRWVVVVVVSGGVLAYGAGVVYGLWQCRARLRVILAAHVPWWAEAV
jgi:hypothetical protein